MLEVEEGDLLEAVVERRDLSKMLALMGGGPDALHSLAPVGQDVLVAAHRRIHPVSNPAVLATLDASLNADCIPAIHPPWERHARSHSCPAPMGLRLMNLEGDGRTGGSSTE
jgi:hypothetical protein